MEPGGVMEATDHNQREEGFTPTPTHRCDLAKGEGGFTIIEILITTFIIGTVVTGLFGLFVLSLRTSQESERRIVAVALADEKMEMVRNLPYLNVGTVGGVPSGSIPQSETVSRNGLDYTVQTDVRYVDDPYDGSVGGSTQDEDHVTICHKPGTTSEQTITVGAPALDAHLAHGDTTGACGSGGEGTDPGDEYNADYKQVRVSVGWNSPNNTPPVLLITYVVPQGIEGSELGGTLDFQALDADGIGVPNADVVITNTTTTPAINISTQTNSEGRVVLPGFPEAADSYALAVSKAGFTSEQTYDPTVTFFPDPDHSHLSMINKQITSKTFFIDAVSGITVHTVDEGGTPVANVAYELKGTKTIGVDDSNNPVYVVDEAATSGASGTNSHSDIPWDVYTITVDGDATGYDIKETSEVMPIVLDPGEAADVTVTLVPHTPLSLHVTSITTDGAPIDNTTVHLYNGSGYDETLISGAVGQVFFADLPATGDYTMEIDAPGYEPSSSTVTIDQSERLQVKLIASS